MHARAAGTGNVDYQVYIFIALVLMLGGVSKGATGMGLPLIALPGMALFTTMPHAIVVVLLPVILTNVWQVWRFRGELRNPRLRFLAPFIPAGIVGVALGTWALTNLPPRWMELVLGLLLLAYFVLRMLHPTFTVSEPAARRFAIPVGTVAGTLQGATGISAPVGVTFIHAQRHGREAHLFAVSAMFLVFALSQAGSLAYAGFLHPRWLAESAVAILPIIVGMSIGEWLSKRLSREAFDRMILVFLALMGLKMTLGL